VSDKELATAHTCPMCDTEFVDYGLSVANARVVALARACEALRALVEAYHSVRNIRTPAEYPGKAKLFNDAWTTAEIALATASEVVDVSRESGDSPLEIKPAVK
jgi:hypothetical protein